MIVRGIDGDEVIVTIVVVVGCVVCFCVVVSSGDRELSSPCSKFELLILVAFFCGVCEEHAAVRFL